MGFDECIDGRGMSHCCGVTSWHVNVGITSSSGILCCLSFLSGLLSREPIYVYEANIEVDGTVTDNQANCYQVKREDIILPDTTSHL